MSTTTREMGANGPAAVLPTPKARRFNQVLIAAKVALDSIGMPFHLHSGTALGAHRERSFIEHDGDIDLAVFHGDAPTAAAERKVVDAMLVAGFGVHAWLGSLARGREIQFTLEGVSLDIVWVYKGEYRGKKLYFVCNYFCRCETFPHKTCVLGYRPYTPQLVPLLGNRYQCLPRKALAGC